jgi:AraC family transcriptional regulator of adaptative response / DNA-3-methyladenine glycosylase II
MFAADIRNEVSPVRSRSPGARRFKDVDIELTYRSPLDLDALIRFLALRAVPGVEQVTGGAYRRSLRLAGGPGVIELRPGGDNVKARLLLASEADRPAAEAAARALLDLNADPEPIAAALGDDPLLEDLVRANPGRRVPGCVDPSELAIRAVIGQQISLVAAKTLAGRLVAAHGEPLPEPVGAVTHLFPSPASIAALAAPDLPMPRSRGRALIALATALAAGELVLGPGADLDASREALLALPGIGPWTTSYIEMRALGNGDAFLVSDLGLRHALERLGEDGDPAAATRLGERWRPYRAYALQHLWATLEPTERRIK